MVVLAPGKTIHRLLSFASIARLSAFVVPFCGLKSATAVAQRSADYSSVRNIFTSSRMRIERDGATNTITYHPPDGSHSATVVLMHGLGDSGDGLADLAEEWGKQLPHVKFILPTADQRPVTLNGGMRMNAWYDIVGLDDRAAESCDGIEESAERIRALLAHEHSLGLPYSRMLLAGFSQGGAMSLYTGLQLPQLEHGPDAHALAGVVVMSGYLAGASMFKLTEGLHNVPVLHCHGDADPVVRVEWARMTEQGLKSKGVTDYTLKYYRGLGHSINMEELRDVLAFLQARLPQDPAYCLKPKAPREMSIKELKAAVRAAGLGARAQGFYEKEEFVRLLEQHHAAGAK